MQNNEHSVYYFLQRLPLSLTNSQPLKYRECRVNSSTCVEMPDKEMTGDVNKEMTRDVNEEQT